MVEDDGRARLWEAVVAHRERLLRLSRSRTATAQDAEDCVQEAMLRCMEFENLDESRLGPFLTTVTLRLCADRYRERANDERLRRRLGFGHREEPGHEDDVCDRSEAAWLALRFRELTPRQQEVVRARETGLSCAEVASRLQMSYVSVESALARARSRFRDTLAKSMGAMSPAVLRWSTTCAEVATAAAVVVGTMVTVPLPLPHSDAPAIALPETAVRRPARAPLVSKAMHITRTAVARPERRRGPAVSPTHMVTVEGPEDREPTVEVKPDNDDYPAFERVRHCVRYGIDMSEGFRCRYPDE